MLTPIGLDLYPGSGARWRRTARESRSAGQPDSLRQLRLTGAGKPAPGVAGGRTTGVGRSCAGKTHWTPLSGYVAALTRQLDDARRSWDRQFWVAARQPGRLRAVHPACCTSPRASCTSSFERRCAAPGWCMTLMTEFLSDCQAKQPLRLEPGNPARLLAPIATPASRSTSRPRPQRICGTAYGKNTT